ncbi:MAG: anhydro-N-acetylmuramic acid kinase, partial [Endozoicomonas sp.]
MSNYYIGLMSGTSLDALDAVLVECGDDNNIRQLYAVA